MHALGPFEDAPRLAVAVSGGADSMALCLLAHEWAEARGGSVTALTVDHGLRPEAAAEVAQVGSWMARLGIRHVVLRWTGPKPATGIQGAARVARYRLLIGWCCGEGVLHLLLGHHARDQAETMLFRVVRGSGITGLAGMAPLLQTRELRLLRPLLAQQPAVLRHYLEAHGQRWIEDPGNRDARYARNRLRALLPVLGEAGLTMALLGQVSARMAEARAAMDAAVAALVARSCQVYPAGYVCIDRAQLAAAAPEVAVLALTRVATAVGGGSRECDRGPVRRTLDELRRGAAVSTTFGRCRLQARYETLLVCREVRGLPSPVGVEVGDRLRWDGRFRITLRRGEGGAKREDIMSGRTGNHLARLTMRPLTAGDGRELQEAAGNAWASLPTSVRLTLPVLEDDVGLLAAPVVGWQRPSTTQFMVVEALWSPRNGIAGPGYFLGEGNSFIFAAN